MQFLRTPDDRFVDLPDFPFEPRYVDVPAGDGSGSARLAYLDEGPADGEVVLCLHGEPSWSFLYRHMIPVLVDAGLRVVAPDLIGFGRSDKPAERTDCTYQRHVDWLRAAVFDHLDLRGITLVCQDWGGLLGLRLVAEHPERFSRVVAANTFLPTGDRDPGDAFRAWQSFSQEVPELPVGAIVNGGCATDLSPEVIAGYDAPFPDETYKEAARQFPLLVPSTPDDPASEANRAAWVGLAAFDRPFLCAFSDKDPITAGADRALERDIAGAEGQPHTTIEGGGHFLQEDCGPELAAVVAAFVAATPEAAGPRPGS
ncbi:MAG: Haloalkane dehalogenase [Acidimicrobiales bacterium]|nr:Haloalkane dehalogenase [Acidimicrobiales bacterium]